MAYCDSIMLSSPYPGPKLLGRAEDRRARVLERGNTLEPCPGCGGEAEVEPPCTVTRNGLAQMAVCRRCPTCGPSWSVGETIALAPKPILTPAPDELCSVCGGLVPRGFRCDHPDADIVTITPPEEEIIMPQVSEAACECGCGEPAAPGKRFASGRCGKSFAGRQGAGKPRKSKSESKLCECGCGELAAPGNRFVGRQCSKRAWRERQWRENPAAASAPAPSPSPHRPPAVSAPSLHRPPAVPAPAPTTARQVLDYLLGLAPEQREALADLVAAQEACARLGVAL